jgi:hypothetical protein
MVFLRAFYLFVLRPDGDVKRRSHLAILMLFILGQIVPYFIYILFMFSGGPMARSLLTFHFFYYLSLSLGRTGPNFRS